MQQSGGTIGVSLEAELTAAHAAVTAHQLHLLEVIAACDRDEVWRADGCRDLAQWLCARLGISSWAARRWITAAHMLPRLSGIRAAFAAGTLSLDKVAELCRFATPDSEQALIPWARRVTVRAIRRRADLAKQPALEDVREADHSRFLRYWWFDDDKRLGLEGSLPAAQGAAVAKALDRLAKRMPDIVTDDDPAVDEQDALDARRADALVALASAALAGDQDADRATVVVHADLAALCEDGRGCELEGGPVIHPETARRLACDARVEMVLHDRTGAVVGIGHASRNVPPWLARQLRQRDRGCVFPGCEGRWFLHAHHIMRWPLGPTDLLNLVLVCPFHHKLVHEHRWRVELAPDGSATWSRPDGRRYDPGHYAEQGLPDRAPPGDNLIA
jgi:hypothetical protein